MSITAEEKQELVSIFCKELDQRERRKTANRSVYRRICASLIQELSAFDYKCPHHWTGADGTTHQSVRFNPCAPSIEVAVSTLLRIVCQVDSTAKLPAEREAEMKMFVKNVLELMKSLKEEVK